MKGKKKETHVHKTAVFAVNNRCYYAKTYFFYEKFEERRHSDSDLVLPKKQSPE